MFSIDPGALPPDPLHAGRLRAIGDGTAARGQDSQPVTPDFRMSFDVMSYVIMNPFVPLYSNGFGPTR